MKKFDTLPIIGISKNCLNPSPLPLWDSNKRKFNFNPDINL